MNACGAACRVVFWHKITIWLTNTYISETSHCHFSVLLISLWCTHVLAWFMWPALYTSLIENGDIVYPWLGALNSFTEKYKLNIYMFVLLELDVFFSGSSSFFPHINIFTTFRQHEAQQLNPHRLEVDDRSHPSHSSKTPSNCVKYYYFVINISEEKSLVHFPLIEILASFGK